jgi:hypothetical protein
MAAVARLAAHLYGERMFHLIVVLAALALGGYVVVVLGVRNLFNPTVWWQSIAVWFAVAVIAHDLILFPLYALADRLLARPRHHHGGAPRHPSRRIPLTNYLRMPTLAAGLLLVMFLPGIIKQGAPTYHAATGLSQAPYLSRWLLLTATFYLTSAIWYAVKTLLGQRRSADGAATSAPATTPPAQQSADPHPAGPTPSPRITAAVVGHQEASAINTGQRPDRQAGAGLADTEQDEGIADQGGARK